MPGQGVTRMGRPRARRLGGLGALATVVGALASAGPALATTATQTITSTGPMTGLTVGNDLDCQVQYAGWSGGAFYPTASIGNDPSTGDCGTFVSVGASIYGPDFDDNYASGTGISLTTAGNYVAYTPGTQSSVSGAGTSTNPYSVTSSAVAGTSGITVSETDRYVTGANGFSTAITLTNTTGAPVSGLLYRAVDCYLQGSDDGYGDAESDGAIVCSTSANDTAGGPAEELDPSTAGSHYVEGYFNNLWADIDAQTNLPDTCDCTIDEDNSMGLNWDFDVAANSSATYLVHLNFAATDLAPGSGSGSGTGSGSGSGSGSGRGSSTGQGRQSSRHKVRITLLQLVRHRGARASMVLSTGTVGERVRARLHGSGVRRATGSVAYSLYRGRRCTVAHRVLKGKRRTILRGHVPASARVRDSLRPGRYSWQAVYSGDKSLQRAKSLCGSATLTIAK
jgi:hypothetical protein